MKFFCYITLILLILIMSTAYSQQSAQDSQQKPTKGQIIDHQKGLNSIKVDPSAAVVDEHTLKSGDLQKWEITGSWSIQNSKDNSKVSSTLSTGEEKYQISTSNFGATYRSNADDWIITPPITLITNQEQNYKPAKNLLLSFEEYYELESYYDFGIVNITTDDGKTWSTLDVRTGKSSGWQKTVLDVTYYSGQTVKIGFQLKSDESNNYEGWKIKNPVLLSNPLEVTITSINISNFQRTGMVYMNVNVTGTCPDLDMIPRDSFEVYENDILQTKLFDVTPPGQGGSVRMADIVFIMDNSGSMSEEIASVNNNVTAFCNRLKAEGVNAALGLVRFGQSTGNGNPIVENGGVLLTDVDLFRTTIWSRNNTSGSREPGWDALVAASNGFTFRPGVQKIFILITDESAHCPYDDNIGTIRSSGEVINVMLLNSVTVFCMINLNHCTAQQDYSPIAGATNGATYSIWNNFDGIFNAISTQLVNTYVVRYKSSVPTCNGVQRNVRVRVKY